MSRNVISRLSMLAAALACGAAFAASTVDHDEMAEMDAWVEQHIQTADMARP